MKNKVQKSTKSTKGLSLMIAIGRYDGFHLHFKKKITYICIGVIGITIFYYDVESMMVNNTTPEELREILPFE